jgi:hypothetical protein
MQPQCPESEFPSLWDEIFNESQLLNGRNIAQTATDIAQLYARNNRYNNLALGTPLTLCLYINFAGHVIGLLERNSRDALTVVAAFLTAGVPVRELYFEYCATTSLAASKKLQIQVHLLKAWRLVRTIADKYASLPVLNINTLGMFCGGSRRSKFPA